MSHVEPPLHSDAFSSSAGELWQAQRICAAVAIVAGAASAIGWIFDASQFAASWLTAFCMTASLLTGALFFVMTHHVTGAGWSVVVRRLLENVTRVMPWLALMFIPIVLNIKHLYSWSDSARRSADPTLQHKLLWLGPPFFTLRTLLYILIWSFFALRLERWSCAQDKSRDAALSLRMHKLSAPGLLVLALTTSLAAFDWLMSLDDRWISTIYGVTFWAGGFVAALSLLILVAYALRSAGILADVITLEHFQDLGKLLIGFVIFWAYISFSQYFLIWYGNLPEETYWYIARRAGGWNVVSWALPIGHFVIPFFVLLRRGVKRNPRMLAAVAAWLLAFHYLDFYWQVMPTFAPGPNLFRPDLTGPRPHWLDATTLATLLAASGVVFLRACRNRPLVPVGDPRLGESLAFKNE